MSYCLVFKTMLSLAKLSALASGGDNDDDEAMDCGDSVVSNILDSVQDQLNIVTAQEQLPSSILEKMGINKESMKVLTPREIIEVSKHVMLRLTDAYVDCLHVAALCDS